jgi:hypothetical protein
MRWKFWSRDEEKREAVRIVDSLIRALIAINAEAEAKRVGKGCLDSIHRDLYKRVSEEAKEFVCKNRAYY